MGNKVVSELASMDCTKHQMKTVWEVLTAGKSDAQRAERKQLNFLGNEAS